MRERGFTLIELVIVVAIVGILASAAMPLARWSAKRTREYELQQNLRILRNAIDRYHDAAAAGLIEVPEGQTGYPPSLDVLVEGVPLIQQMPPVVPAVSDEYGATGPGLTGGLGALVGGEEGNGNSPPFLQMESVDVPDDGGRRLGRGRAGARSGLRLGVDIGIDGTASVTPTLGLLQGARRDARPGADADQAPPEPLIGPDGQPVMLMLLRRIPVDPFTGKAEWGLRCYGERPEDRLWCGQDVFDVYSKALGDAIDGTKYRDW